MKKSALFIAVGAVAICALPMTACKKTTQKKCSEYVICATYSEDEGKLSGTEKFTFFNSTGNEITNLSFNLWGNAYRKDAKFKPVADAYSPKAYYSGESYGRESVEKVEGCASWEVAGEDENILSITLPAPVYPDQCATVNITFELELAKVNHRTGITKTTVNLGNFYPVLCAYSAEGFIETPYYSCGDPFVSECANYDVSLTMPKEYTAATSGKKLSETAAGDTVTCRYELKNARDFAAVLSDDFKTAKREADGCEVTLYYCSESEPARALDAACESLAYFTRTFGEYAYPTLSVVYTPLYVGGMEYPALEMISDTLNESDGAYTVVHETAHQWWYAAVGSNQIKNAWQDEGLAEYSALCFFENHPQYGFTRTGILGAATKAYRGFYSVYNQIFGKADTSMTRSLSEFASDYEYVNIAYNKGLLTFENVRQAMGDKKFFKALESYYSSNKFKIASVEELVSHFCRLHDVEGLFAGFLGGKVVI